MSFQYFLQAQDNQCVAVLPSMGTRQADTNQGLPSIKDTLLNLGMNPMAMISKCNSKECLFKASGPTQLGRDAQNLCESQNAPELTRSLLQISQISPSFRPDINFQSLTASMGTIPFLSNALSAHGQTNLLPPIKESSICEKATCLSTLDEICRDIHVTLPTNEISKSTISLDLSKTSAVSTKNDPLSGLQNSRFMAMMLDAATTKGAEGTNFFVREHITRQEEMDGNICLKSFEQSYDSPTKQVNNYGHTTLSVVRSEYKFDELKSQKTFCMNSSSTLSVHWNGIEQQLECIKDNAERTGRTDSWCGKAIASISGDSENETDFNTGDDSTLGASQQVRSEMGCDAAQRIDELQISVLSEHIEKLEEITNGIQAKLNKLSSVHGYQHIHAHQLVLRNTVLLQREQQLIARVGILEERLSKAACLSSEIQKSQTKIDEQKERQFIALRLQLACALAHRVESCTKPKKFNLHENTNDVLKSTPLKKEQDLVQVASATYHARGVDPMHLSQKKAELETLEMQASLGESKLRQDVHIL
jgi:hypothetical protein